MILFFIIVDLIATFVLYAIFPAALILYIGIGIAAGLVIGYVYWNLPYNFYILAAFVFLNSIVHIILFFVIPDPVNSGAIWIVYSLFIFSYMKEWTVFLAGVDPKSFLSDDERKHKYVSDYTRTQISNANTDLDTLRYYIVCIPYFLLDLLILFIYHSDLGLKGIVALSPIGVLVCAAIFLIQIKIHGMDPTCGSNDKITSFASLFKECVAIFVKIWEKVTGFFKSFKKSDKVSSSKKYSSSAKKSKKAQYHATAKHIKPQKNKRKSSFSFGDIFSAIGDFFCAIGGGIADFFCGIGRFFKKIFSPKKHYGSSRKSSRSKPQKSSRSYSSGGSFSLLTFILPIAFLAVIIVFLVLENNSIVSSHVGNLGELIIDFVFERSKWFVLTKMAFEDGLMGLNADTFLNLLTLVPLAIIFLALIIIAAVLELVLSIVYALLGLVVAAIAAILSLILTFVPGVLVIASIVITVIDFKEKHSNTNKITSAVLSLAQIVVCVYYFIVLFSHRT